MSLKTPLGPISRSTLTFLPGSTQIIPRRQNLQVAEGMSHTCRSAFELYGQVWAALVTIDRQTRDREKRRGLMGEMLTNGLEDQPRTLAALGRIIGRGWRATPWEPFLL